VEKHLANQIEAAISHPSVRRFLLKAWIGDLARRRSPSNFDTDSATAVR
jgi:hypothetical protein